MPRTLLKCLLCLSVLSLTACYEKKETATEEPQLQQLQQPSRVLDYLSLGARFLINQQQPDGFFKYEYDFITGNYSYWDNIIHQTRAGYTLAQYYVFLIRNNINTHTSSIVLDSTLKALKGYAAVSIPHENMPGKLISFYYNKSGSAGSDMSRVSTRHRLQRLEAEISATAFALMTELTYWGATNDNSFADSRLNWRAALIYHAKHALSSPVQKNMFMPYVWQALAIYAQANPGDEEVVNLLPQMDAYFTALPRSMKDVEDYTWDMLAANQRYMMTGNMIFANFAARQTTQLLENLYTQHDTTVNSCSLSLGLVEASLILTGKNADMSRIEQTALGRSQLEYYSSLKYTILPNQTWIVLGPGRTLHSQEFKKFAGGSLFGQHTPRTNIGLAEMCLLAGLRFSSEDIKELKQTQAGRE